jgi:phosphoribosylanthranilate isomerase
VSLGLPADRVAVKICGVTSERDARAAIEAGADLLGFNTWPGSKRYLDLSANAGWIASLPVSRVALLVNAAPAEAARVAALPFIDALQLHGDEDRTYCAELARLGKPIIKALRVREPADFSEADQFSTREVLLDAHVPGAFGGTGSRVDLSLAREFAARHPALSLWIAGGLVPENVAEVIRAVRPRVVDVSSGVENGPGSKDFRRMQAFCAASRES